MNETMVFGSKCSWYAGKRPARSLTNGVYFVHNGYAVKFLHYTGLQRNTRYGTYQSAWVLNSEGSPKKISLNMAGSVTLVQTRP